MKMMDGIPYDSRWKLVQKIHKGWSEDSKYYVEDVEGEKLLLRVSDINVLEKKRREFEMMGGLRDVEALLSRPVDFGVSEDGQYVYSLLTWIEGEDARDILVTLNEKEQYRLGVRAGEILRQIHEIPVPKAQEPWEIRFGNKADRKIKMYEMCPIQVEGMEKMAAYVKENKHLLKDRPQSFQHGDYHEGNMVITKGLELGIIDFNRWDYGDPWEEFNRIPFSVDASPLFASGYINGYFNHQVPDVFFKLMALYIASNQLSSISWAIPFGEKDIDVMVRQAKAVLEWYNGFEIYIPNWYVNEF